MASISFGYRVDMQAIASPSEGFIVAYDLDGILKQKDHTGLVSQIGGSSSTIINNSGGDSFTFSSDLVVSLSNGKTFGKYETGTTIPALGKTTSEVLIDSLSEPLNPILTLDCPTIIKYNQREISNELTFSYSIISLGATVSSVVLEFRKNNTGTWTPLSYLTNIYNLTHHYHDDNGFNTEPYNYRYTVIDSKGASSSITKDVTPMSYIPPTINLSVIADVKTSPETDLRREKGNIVSILSGTVSRNNELVGLINYQLQYKKSGSSTWTFITVPPIQITGITNSISTIYHYDPNLSNASSVLYRVLVTDEHQIFYNTTFESTPVNVDFLNMIFFGSTSSVPTVGSQIRPLSGRIFTNGSNPFISNSGLTYSIFVVAMPATLTLTGWTDLDANGSNIAYTSTVFDVGTFDGVATSYKVYTSVQAVPYSPSHRHQITRL